MAMTSEVSSVLATCQGLRKCEQCMLLSHLSVRLYFADEYWYVCWSLVSSFVALGDF
ncbi:hypothetical protein BDQ94DRAFT_155353 [Aspergillus welwitschiae]|uniref:Uncharacterized protein n=1 Tax=Aspergillus welwitschiae TaxID=1341132 RepID=A0A3F3PJK6_9EURO|nr:hypothetical protein BDQ94DRAFT_155353 [Aspergillus welwitschiae]RDH26556.1 hypothetical protein BDQ94DRAFT_155353 [Aspergillus welwitschiae]